MELIFKRRPSRVDGFAPTASIRGIAALYYKTRHETVEQRPVVIAIEAVLEEVAAGEGCLLCEELEGEVAGCGCQENFGGGWRLEIVDGGHFFR